MSANNILTLAEVEEVNQNVPLGGREPDGGVMSQGATWLDSVGRPVKMRT